MNGNKKDDLTLASNASILVGPVEFGNSHKIGGAAVGWVGAITSETILIICRYFQQNFALRQPLANRVYNRTRLFISLVENRYYNSRVVRNQNSC